MRRRLIALTLVAPVLLGSGVLAGCTTVPSSSAPQTVQPINLDDGGSSAAAPQRNASPRTIVSDFLDANATDPVNHASARTYLTPTARNQWSDQRITIISDRQIKTFDPESGTLQVTGRVVGTISADGVYQPSLAGTGDGGAAATFPFTLTKVDGQYRIDQLRSGLLITDDQFRASYQQHVIYFYDLLEHSLVPDVRWTDIPGTDVVELGNWLVSQLVAGPRPELQDVVSADTFPTQANPDRIIAREVGGSLKIEIPGSAQLDSSVLDRLALQVMRTLDQTVPGGTVTITDGGSPVLIPDVGGTSFTSSSFPEQPSAPQDQSPDVYYLNSGRIVSATDKPIAGPLGSGSYYLSSFAVARRPASGPLLIAGVGAGPRQSSELYLSSQLAKPRLTTIRGELTRPTWAPGRSEVWIGDGSDVHRIIVNGSSYQDSTVQLPPTVSGGRIRSVRLSPDGQQIALVVSGPDTPGGGLFVGAIVRDSSGVRVAGLSQVSPLGVLVTDADWNTSLRLTAIGSIVNSGAPSVFEVGADGTFWRNLGLDNLPDAPQNVTASPAGAWVEAQQQVWEQSGGGPFLSPSPTGQQAGEAPAYIT